LSHPKKASQKRTQKERQVIVALLPHHHSHLHRDHDLINGRFFFFPSQEQHPQAPPPPSRRGTQTLRTTNHTASATVRCRRLGSRNLDREEAADPPSDRSSALRQTPWLFRIKPPTAQVRQDNNLATTAAARGIPKSPPVLPASRTLCPSSACVDLDVDLLAASVASWMPAQTP
jgi:hypothetical protein